MGGVLDTLDGSPLWPYDKTDYPVGHADLYGDVTGDVSRRTWRSACSRTQTGQVVLAGRSDLREMLGG